MTTTEAALSITRARLQELSRAIDALGDAWAADPANRNRADRQVTMLELASCIRLLRAAEILDQIEDTLAPEEAAALDTGRACDACGGRGYFLGVTGYASQIEGAAQCIRCNGTGQKVPTGSQ